MLIKPLLDLIQLRLYGTLSRNIVLKSLVGYPLRFSNDSSYNVQHVCTSVQDNYVVDYGLNLPDIKIFSSLTKDPTTEKKIKLILMEHALARMSGENVPRSLSVMDMEELLTTRTACERLDLYDIFYLKEAKQNLLKVKRNVEGRTQWDKNRKFLENSYEAADHIRYSMNHNSLHKHIEGAWVKQFDATRLARASRFGQPFVFDFGYDQYMTRKECDVTAKLVNKAYIENRQNREPFDLYFTNYDPSQCIVAVETERLIHTHYSPNTMISPSDKNYLEVFPKKACIYLSPHSDKTLQTFNHEAVYIIGAYWALQTPEAQPVIRARKDGVPCFKIPMEIFSSQYPTIHERNSLTLMMKALLKMKQLSTSNNRKVFLSANLGKDRKLNYHTSQRFKFLLKDYW